MDENLHRDANVEICALRLLDSLVFENIFVKYDDSLEADIWQLRLIIILEIVISSIFIQDWLIHLAMYSIPEEHFEAS